MKKFSTFIIKLTLICLVLFSVGTSVTYALGDYTVLAPLPGLQDDTTNKTDFEKYLPNAFNLAIAIAAVMAFVMITFGGIMYATTDAINKKSEGRTYVENAIWGLLLVIGAWAILNTINPKILNFTLDIKQITTDNTTPVASSPRAGTGCVGTACTHTYVSGGETVNYKDCFNCTDAVDTKLNIKTTTINGQKAQINTDLANSLVGVQKDLGPIAFQVTETWPPTSNHSAQGQYDGTSVDVAMRPPSPASAKKFISSSESKGLRVQYEVPNSAQQQAYINAGIPSCVGQGGSGCVRVVSGINAEHFSVYK